MNTYKKTYKYVRVRTHAGLL